MDLHKIYGPPGTGKTTRLLGILQEEIERGIHPHEIAFVSFTKKAAEEGKVRTRELMDVSAGDLANFRTLHSMAFKSLGIRRSEVIQIRHYRELCRQLGIEYVGQMTVEDGVIAGDKEGDRYLFLDQLSRNRRKDLRDQWKDTGEDLNWPELEYFITALRKFKEQNGLLDFTDMLEQGLRENPLPIRVAIIDEAQDMTPLQWTYALHVLQNADRIYVAGDDDQAIYNWSGADAGYFNTLRGTSEVLSRSYRLPGRLHRFANKISGLISERKSKDWEPDREGGDIEYHAGLDYVDLSKGEWLILARNKYLLTELMESVRAQGYHYTSRMGSSINNRHLRGILGLENMRRKKSVSVGDARVASELAGVDAGKLTKMEDDKRVHLNHTNLDPDLNWYKQLSGISTEDREYYSALIQNGEKLTGDSRIHIDTIHGVKGGEADNVLLCSDMSYRTWRGFQDQPDHEHRVFYVGVTRARKALHILMPQTDKSYNNI